MSYRKYLAPQVAFAQVRFVVASFSSWLSLPVLLPVEEPVDPVALVESTHVVVGGAGLLSCGTIVEPPLTCPLGGSIGAHIFCLMTGAARHSNRRECNQYRWVESIA